MILEKYFAVHLGGIPYSTNLVLTQDDFNALFVILSRAGTIKTEYGTATYSPTIQMEMTVKVISQQEIDNMVVSQVLHVEA